MRTLRWLGLVLALGNATAAPLGSTITYQGQLKVAGAPASGNYDFRFTLYDDPALASPVSGAIAVNDLAVSNGLVTTPVDFGFVPASTGNRIWLAVEVRDGASTGAYTLLTPRREVTGQLYSFHALEAEQALAVAAGAVDQAALGGNAVTSSKIADGTVAAADVDATQVQRRVSGNCAAGSSIRAIAQDGTVTCEADDGASGWSTSGNAGLLANAFLGSTDNHELLLKGNNQRVGAFFPSSIGAPSVVLGGPTNVIDVGVSGAAIGGGGDGSAANANSVYDNFGTVAGGSHNSAGCSDGNTTSCAFATVGGGSGNFASKSWASIGGGSGNSASGNSSTIAGGSSNLTVGTRAAIGGGGSNQASGDDATVSGGASNAATALAATVAGGSNNTASAQRAAIGGGSGNIASGIFATVPGGAQNTAFGQGSFAAGQHAYAQHDGAFVWADDSSASTFSSTGINQFAIRADGGVGINVQPQSSPIELSVAANKNGANYANLYLRQRDVDAGILASAGEATTAAANDAAFYLDQYGPSGQARILQIAANKDLIVFGAAFKPGGGSWSVSSDARLKRDIEPLEGALDRLLELRGTTYEYIDPKFAMGLPGRQTGFIAQEVQRVFPDWVAVGPHGYLTVAPHGFEALTVEALRELKTQADVRIEALEARNARLEESNVAVARANAALAARLARIERVLGAAAE